MYNLYASNVLTFSRNVSRFVIFRTAHSVSCTMPMTGRLACGVMIMRGTDANSLISARVSSDWARWRFISSPSKSALYGVVTLKHSQYNFLCLYLGALQRIFFPKIRDYYGSGWVGRLTRIFLLKIVPK